MLPLKPPHHILQILAVTGILERIGKARELRHIDVSHVQRDFFRARDLQALPPLERASCSAEGV